MSVVPGRKRGAQEDARQTSGSQIDTSRRVTGTWRRRIKRLMMSGALGLGALGGLTAAAPAAYAGTPGPIRWWAPPPVHLGDGSGCSSDNLTAYGWNFTNGENLAVKFYVDGNLIGNPVSTTANQAGYLQGFFSADISTYLGGYNAYTASVTEPDGYTWWATEQVIC